MTYKATIPPLTDSADVKDAARYRRLRAQTAYVPAWKERELSVWYGGRTLDAAIDAAMSHSADGGLGGEG